MRRLAVATVALVVSGCAASRPAIPVGADACARLSVGRDSVARIEFFDSDGKPVDIAKILGPGMRLEVCGKIRRVGRP